MKRTRMALASLATISMVFSVSGAAFAQGTSTWETRADFILQLDKALGIQPVYPATPDFQDVSISSPYYGYIEAAYQDGITNGIAQGIFGPSLPITRAEAAKYLVIAFGAGSSASGITSTKFTDNSSIPSSLVGYVGEAAALGLMKGFPDGSFNPDGNLTVTEEGYLLGQLTSAMSALKLTVTPSATDVAPGQIVTLQTSGVTASGVKVSSPVVTYSVTGKTTPSAVLTGNSFVGSAPGNYTVEASSGTAAAQAVIAVYGAAVGLRVSAPATIVANDASTATAQVSVVDANGNVVGNSTDALQLSSGTETPVAGFLPPGQTTLVPSSTVDAVNGVATFTLTAGSVAGATETLTGSDTQSTALTDGTAQISGTAQVPTSISATAASPYLSSNTAAGSDQLSAQVLDQTGNPMLSGAYTVSFAVTSGPANFQGSATAAGVYYGPSTSPAGASLGDVQGSTGPVVVTASATGLTASTVDVTAVIAGSASQIAMTKSLTATAGTNATYTVTVEDSHGYPVPYTGQLALTDSDTTGINAGPPTAGISATTLSFTGQASQTFTVYDDTVGSYTLTAATTAADTAALTSAASTLDVVAGPVAIAVLSPGVAIVNGAATGPIYPVVMPLSTKSINFTAHLADQYGNPVVESGVTIYIGFLYGSFQSVFSPPGPNFGTVTLSGGGQSVTSLPNSDSPGPVPAPGDFISVVTDATGTASATVTPESYVGDGFLLMADLAAPTTFVPTSITDIYGFANQVPSGPISLTVKDSSTGAVVSSLVAGKTYVGSFQVTDQNGNNVNAQETYSVALSGTGTAEINGSVPSGLVEYTTDGSGVGTFTITPETSGSLAISLQDVTGYEAPLSTTQLSITPGSEVSQFGFASGGAEVTQGLPLSVTSGQAVPITVSAEDAGGNPIVTANEMPAYIAANGVSGELRDTATGADIQPTTYLGVSYYLVDIPAGQTGATFYFLPTSTGSVYFSTPSAAPLSISASLATHTVTFTVADVAGNVMAGEQVEFSLGAGQSGTLSTASATTNASGQVSVTVSGVTAGTTVDVTCTILGTGIHVPIAVSF